MAVLVTGAAGLLGGALVAALTGAGHPVIGLVHREATIRDNAGKALAATECDPASPPRGLVVLHGDIAQARLGLDSAAGAWLERHVSAIIHCAALVRFDAEWEALEAVNVAGIRHVAALCPDARFIHVSTAYVCGLRDGPIPEAPCDPAGPFGNLYERSKALGEAELHRLRPAAVIARPSIIVGEQASGRIRSFDTIYRAFKFIAEGKIAAVPASAEATLNFVPIDHVVRGIVALLALRVHDGRIVHLAAREAVAATRFLGLIGGVPGLRCPRILTPQQHQHTGASVAERLARPYWGYFQRYPDFATDALADLTGIAAPVWDDPALLRQITFCAEAGFLRKGLSAKPVQRTSG
ncbi:SDR family oxidoreductase [Erythrobacter donghaensis]|uniref:SDR family oxidoreductase n=1 Tax=Erythrobacter donghaensis TaxID=267135 RepID=UPI0009BE69ED|nr:SDR family oxidoreductase [Erythrobacter donghaensis]